MLDSMHKPCISIAVNAIRYISTVRVRNIRCWWWKLMPLVSIASMCMHSTPFFSRQVFVIRVLFISSLVCFLFGFWFWCLRFRVAQNFSICLVLMMAVQQDRPTLSNHHAGIHCLLTTQISLVNYFEQYFTTSVYVSFSILCFYFCQVFFCMCRTFVQFVHLQSF